MLFLNYHVMFFFCPLGQCKDQTQRLQCWWADPNDMAICTQILGVGVLTEWIQQNCDHAAQLIWINHCMAQHEVTSWSTIFATFWNSNPNCSVASGEQVDARSNAKTSDMPGECLGSLESTFIQVPLQKQDQTQQISAKAQKVQCQHPSIPRVF